MPKIKVKELYGCKLIMVLQKNYNFVYIDTEDKRIPQSAIGFGNRRGTNGRILEITAISKNRQQLSTISLNGNQINTLIRILEEAGEI